MGERKLFDVDAGTISICMSKANDRAYKNNGNLELKSSPNDVKDLLRIVRNAKNADEKVAHDALDLLLESEGASLQQLWKLGQDIFFGSGTKVRFLKKIQNVVLVHPFVTKEQLKFLAKYGVHATIAKTAFGLLYKHKDLTLEDLQEMLEEISTVSKHEEVKSLARKKVAAYKVASENYFLLLALDLKRRPSLSK